MGITKADSDLQINKLLKLTIKRWPILFAVGMIGALIGFLLTLLRPPIYSSAAVLGVNINYGVTEPLELVVEDRALHRVEGLLKADLTLEMVLEQLPTHMKLENNWSTPSRLRENLRLERQLSEWNLVATHTDPEIAAKVAQTWAESSLTILDESAKHAWRAAGLMGENPLGVDCIQVPISYENKETYIWECTLETIELDPESLSGTLQTELALSHGLLPNISYELLQEATVLVRPIVWARGPMILSGLLAAMLVGFWVVVVRIWAINRKTEPTRDDHSAQ
jgi:hypothetical protein